MDDTIADEFLLDAIITLVDAKHANHQLDEHEVVHARWVSRTGCSSRSPTSSMPPRVDDLSHRLVHMNPRAAIKVVNFGDADIKEIFDLRGFNLNAKLEIDPDFLAEDEHDHDHAHDARPRRTTTMHDHAPAATITATITSTTITITRTTTTRSSRSSTAATSRSTRIVSKTSSAASCRSTASGCCATRACSI